MFRSLEGADFSFLTSCVSMIYPFHESWGAYFSPIVMFMLASLTHHFQWIQSTLHTKHTLFSNPIFTTTRLSKLHSFLCDETDKPITATGVPPHTVLIQGLTRVETKLDLIITLLRDQPDSFKRIIHEAFHTHNIQNETVSMSVLKEMLQKQNETIRDIVKDHVPTVPITSITPASTNQHTEPIKYKIWWWAHETGRKSDKIIKPRMTPKDFVLSFDLKSHKRLIPVDCDSMEITRQTVTAFDAWVWWWKGLKFGEDFIRPLRKLSEKECFLKNTRKRFNDLSNLIREMIRLIQEKGLSVSVLDENLDTQISLFRHGWQLVVDFIHTHHPHESKRSRQLKETISYTTLKNYYYMSKNNSSM